MPSQRSTRRSGVTSNQPRFLGRSDADAGDLPEDEDEEEAEMSAASDLSGPGENIPQNIPEGPSASSGGTPSAELRAGLRVEWLDPKTIAWPQGRISSEYDQERLSELAHSLAVGQEDPLIVRQLEDGSYEGAGGMNRCIAAIESGIQQVMCVVRAGTHQDVVRANLRTALNQARPNPLSEVEGVAHAHHDVGLTIAEIMADSGKSQTWVEDRLAIFEASPVVKQCLGDGIIALGHAVLLAGIEDLAEQERFLRDLQTYGWSIKELEDAIRGIDDDDDDGTHEVSFSASNRPRERQPRKCAGCGADDDSSEVQTLPVCEACSEYLRERSVNPPGEGEAAAPAGLLREAASLLAGVPAGVNLAERLEQLLEDAGLPDKPEGNDG